MINPRVWASASLFLFFFATGYFFYQSTVSSDHPASADFASRSPASRIWALGGYLPENPNQKVFLVITDRTITGISAQRPNGIVLDTESLIFPGLMDMHNHIKYNVLPLWNLGKSQFNNRFEWRKKFPPYKDAVSFNMRPIKGDVACAAVRWAELKALSGGATSMQGIGNDTKCAAAFGPMNIEIPGDLTSGKIRAGTDIFDPALVGSVYIPHIGSEIQRRRGEWATTDDVNQNRLRAVYDSALMNLLQRTGILQWLETLANQPRSLSLGVRLMIGLELPFPDNSPASFDRALPSIQQHLVTVHQMKPNAVAKQIANMRIWLYGKDGRSGYLSLPFPPRPLRDFELIADSKTMDYFGKAGVISLDPKVRRYLAMFETSMRRSILNYLDSRDRLALVAHLSEGRRGDPYNRMEYNFAYEFGYTRPGLVMIHGVGLDQNQMADAARKGLSVVWSPFSNLLLYGETLDVVTARKMGLNIAMGPDWTPTGSKHMLDELKIARRYLNKIRVPQNVISDKDLVDMATINGARALNLDRGVGRVAPGYLANLLLVDKSNLTKANGNPYTALILSEQEHVNLVVVGGEPLYGDPRLIQAAAQSFRDVTPVETLPRNQQACRFQKAFRNPWFSPYDQQLQGKGLNLRTPTAIETILRGQMNAYAQEVRAREPRKVGNLVALDPIYSCEDDYYRNEFARYIEVSLEQNIKARAALRQQFRLSDQWTPLATPAEGEEEEDADSAM